MLIGRTGTFVSSNLLLESYSHVLFTYDTTYGSTVVLDFLSDSDGALGGQRVGEAVEMLTATF